MKDPRTELAERALAKAIVDLIDARLAGVLAQAEWVDQRSSPLGRRRHCELVRSGVLPGTRDGKRVLVRRSDIEAYLERRRVVKVDERAEDEAEAARIIDLMTKRRAG